jgi:hypothetical protein
MCTKHSRSAFVRSLVVLFLLTFQLLVSGNYAQARDVTSLEFNSISSSLSTDVNGDGKVDIQDLSEVASSYGIRSGDSRWKAKYDINNDGLIDIFDLTLVSKDIGKVVSPPAPKPNPPYFVLDSITLDGYVTFYRSPKLETIIPTGYRFYVGKSEDGPWQLAAEGNGYTNIFTITFPVGSTQYVKFTALNGTTESDPQGPYYLAVLPRPTGIHYYTHGQVGQIGSLGWIDLRWNSVPGAVKYNVYYKDAYDLNASFIFAGSVTSPQINIYNIPYYKAFRYRIVPVNKDNIEGSLHGETTASILGEGGPYN